MAGKDARFVLWALPKGETDRLQEHPLTSMPITHAQVVRVKRAASADGWHGFRTTVDDGQLPDFRAAVRPMQEADIVHQAGRYWVGRLARGAYGIYRDGATAATRVYLYQPTPDQPDRRRDAITHCDHLAERDTV